MTEGKTWGWRGGPSGQTQALHAGDLGAIPRMDSDKEKERECATQTLEVVRENKEKQKIKTTNKVRLNSN